MILTGLQPTGAIHLGNYLAAIRPAFSYAANEPTLVMVADLHAMTNGHRPDDLAENVHRLAAMMLAVDPQSDITLFRQSRIPQHAELAWILMCVARTGWLNRMVQYRDKVEALAEIENAESPSVGFYAYPVLQAADILLYGADKVPVGEDQSQHLNLAVDIAERFNREFGETFTVPKPVIASVKRVQSLYDPTKKMSKSDANDDHRINLDDDADTIRRKIKRATSDTGLIPGTVEEVEARPPLRSLLSMLCEITQQTLPEALEALEGKGYGVLKPMLAEALIEHLRPIQTRYRALYEDRIELERTLDLNEQEVRKHAKETMRRVNEAVGLRMIIRPGDYD